MPTDSAVEAGTVTPWRADTAAPSTATADPTRHWSIRKMAAAIGLSYASVQRIWKAHELKPHRVKTFKLSNDKRFVGMSRHRHQEWLKLLRRIDADTPKHLDVHLIAAVQQ